MLLVLIFLLLAGAAGAEQNSAFTVTGAHVVDYGVYETIRIGDKDAADTSAGHVHMLHDRLDPALRNQTDRIPGRVGVHFGFRFQVDGSPQLAVIPLRVRVLHPAFTNPSTGRSWKTDEWDAPGNIGIPRFTGWAFDEPYEVVPGEWTIQVLMKGRVIAKKKFRIVPEG